MNIDIQFEICVTFSSSHFKLGIHYTTPTPSLIFHRFTIWRSCRKSEPVWRFELPDFIENRIVYDGLRLWFWSLTLNPIQKHVSYFESILEHSFHLSLLATDSFHVMSDPYRKTQALLHWLPVIFMQFALTSNSKTQNVKFSKHLIEDVYFIQANR